MAAARYLKAAFIYMIGIVLIAIGLVMFFASPLPNVMSTSFYVMYMGLAVSVIGGVYGKKKLRSPELKKPGPPRKWPWRREGRKKTPEAPPKEAKSEPKFVEKKVEEDKNVRIVKVLVCPYCGEENKYNAVFCDECGRKLRK
ncbi:MAG: hypothetical protein FJY76_03875 [Candidatus Aenigmarchaeota archaeon]|nr:hypothetical protein [Candidatus Aenigmarchaeota archaeon]